MYFNIKCIGKLLGPTNEFEQSLVLETGEFERPKFDCTFKNLSTTFNVGFSFIFDGGGSYKANLCLLCLK